MMKNKYSKEFFEVISSGSYSSAKVILSILGNYTEFKSMLDVGCGGGTWLQAARTVLSVDLKQSVGIDGSYTSHTHKDLGAQFIYKDLSDQIGSIGRFDLAVCVEVAEHLPKIRATSLVKEICSMSNIVIFGAAIPGQGGTGHINEQWPDYWINIFRDNGFEAFDVFRRTTWEDERVSPWYAQNCFLFVRKDEAICEKMNESKICGAQAFPLNTVHPGIFRLAACESAGPLRLIRALPGRFFSSISGRLGL